MYPVRKCKCGHEHECPRLDPRANGRLRHRLGSELVKQPLKQKATVVPKAEPSSVESDKDRMMREYIERQSK